MWNFDNGGWGGEGRKYVRSTVVEHAGGLGHRVFRCWDWELLDWSGLDWIMLLYWTVLSYIRGGRVIRVSLFAWNVPPPSESRRRAGTTASPLSHPSRDTVSELAPSLACAGLLSCGV